MKLRWKILIIVAAGLLLLAASAVLTLHVQPDSELAAYKKLLRSKGEKLDLAEVLPPPAATEENGASAVLDAIAMSSSAPGEWSAMQMVAPGKAAVGWQQPDVRTSDFTNSWEEYAAKVEADRPAIDMLHQVLDRPKVDFQLNYSLGASLTLPHLAPMKRAAMKLAEAAQLDLHHGNGGAAATNILTMLAIAQRDYRDDLLIGHLVRIAITAIAVPPTWELLQATNITDAQLAAVQQGWQQLNFLHDAENTFATERAWSIAEIQKCRDSHEGFKGFVGYSTASSSSGGWPADWETMTERPRLAVAEVMWRSSWSYSQELEFIKSGQITLETLRTMQTNRSQFYKADYDAMRKRLAAAGSTNLEGAFWRALAIPDFHEDFAYIETDRHLGRTLQMETARDIVVTAVALKRFQLRHGKLPETLAQLTPEFLPAEPIDPNDGKPLKYHPNGDGTYALYSVGEDGIDDGGNTASAPPSRATVANWLRARDWVWPQPATAAEVQNFREHPPK